MSRLHLNTVWSAEGRDEDGTPVREGTTPRAGCKLAIGTRLKRAGMHSDRRRSRRYRLTARQRGSCQWATGGATHLTLVSCAPRGRGIRATATAPSAAIAARSANPHP